MNFKSLIVGLVVFFFISHAQTPVQKYGQLSISGTKVLDKNGNPAQLRGMSFFWSQWMGQYYTANTVKWLRDDWCCSVVRPAMAVDQGGYATNTSEKDKIFTVIDAAIANGMYVIVDFHVHDAALYKSEAKTFFTEVATKYGDRPNIIYEVWNEPLNDSWSSVIKPYHNELIQTIRAIDPDNIIVCGTRQWSQEVAEAANDPVTGTNIAYTLHYYANTHGQSLRDLCSAALSKNVCVFVTEYGTCSADGDGTVNVSESNAWWSFLDQNKISYCNWSISDKAEAASALVGNASVNGNWSTNDLTPSGKLVRDYYKSKCDFDPYAGSNITTTISAPINNAKLTSGSNVTFTTTATTSIGTIKKVQFYINNVLVETDSIAPYSIIIPTLQPGKHALSATTFNTNNEDLNTPLVSIEVLTPVYKTTTPPTIDGTIDDVWSSTNLTSSQFKTIISGSVTNAADLSGSFKTLWDNTNLYILGDINDDLKVNDSPEVYNDDAIEVFLDINNDKSTSYGTNDGQYSFGWNDGNIIVSNPTTRSTTGITYAMTPKTGGYTFEAKIPWSVLTTVTPTAGQFVGFDFHVNDDDLGADRDAKMAWNAPSDNAWQDPSLFGIIVLQNTPPCTAPVAPTVPTTISTYCQYSLNTQVLTATASSGGTLNWYGTSATGGTASINAPAPSTATAGTITYYVSQTISGCESPRASINVNITNASPSPIVSSTINYCINATAAPLTATGTNLNWYTSLTGGTSSTTAPTPSTVTAGTTTYYVTQTTGTCESQRTSISVTINQTSTPTVAANVNYCQNNTAVPLTATGTSLLWYGTNATGGTGSTSAPTPSTATLGTTSYYVTQTLNTCESNRAAIVVNVGTQATAPTTTPIIFCINKTATPLTATGTGLTWYGTNATGGTGSPTAPTPSTSAVGTTTYYVSQTGTSCESPRAALTVTISALPTAPTVTTPVTYSINESTALTATGTNLVWYSTATAGTGSATAIIPTTTTLGTTTYYVSQTNTNGCESPRAAISVIVNANYKVFKTNTPITVDGNIDQAWTNAKILPQSISKVITGAVSNSTDLSGTFKALWDNTYLYVLGEITDDKLVNDSPDSYNDDAVEIFIDINNNKASTYGANDLVYTMGWNDGINIAPTPSTRPTTNVTFSTLAKTGGYIYETRIPWTTLTGTPTIGQALGFDFHINDDDDGIDRDGKLAWTSATDNAWQNPSLLGTAILQDIAPCVTPVKPSVSTSSIAYCQNFTTPALVATASSGGILNWYGTNATGGTASTTAPAPSTTNAGTITYYVSQTLSGCESDRSMVTITVTSTPLAPVFTPISYCQNASVASLVANETNLKWYTSSAIGGTFTTNAPIPSTLTSGTTTYYVSQTVAGCESPKAPLSVTINPLITPTVSINTLPSININKETNVQMSLTTTNLGANPTYQWRKNSANLLNETGTTYTTSTLEDGDVIDIIVTSDALCANPTTVTSTGVVFSVVTSVNDVTFANLEVYPNPSNAFVNINGLKGTFDYSLNDVAGKTIIQGQSSNLIPTDNLDAGIYSLFIKYNQSQKVIKVVIEK